MNGHESHGRDPMAGLLRILEESERRREEDASTFAALDDDLCMICAAYGADKRSLFIDCGYAVNEVVPEALDIRLVEHERGRGYYVLICKACRAALLGKMQEWRNERVALRGVPKDHDGHIEDGWHSDANERNIPVRVNGAVQMMTRDEWEAWRGRQ